MNLFGIDQPLGGKVQDAKIFLQQIKINILTSKKQTDLHLRLPGNLDDQVYTGWILRPFMEQA